MRSYSIFFLLFITIICGCNTGADSNVNFPPTADSIKQEVEFVIKPLDSLLYEDWERYTISDVGFIYAPKGYLHHDEAAYNSLSKQLQSNATSKGVVLEKSEGDTAFFQIGIISKIGNPGTVHKLSNYEYEYEPVTLHDYETIVKPKLTRGAEAMGSTVINSTSVKYDTLNGIFCAGFSFKSISPEINDTINSKIYWINNDDRMHHITLAYTSEFYKENKEEVDKLISSFRVTNVR